MIGPFLLLRELVAWPPADAPQCAPRCARCARCARQCPPRPLTLALVLHINLSTLSIALSLKSLSVPLLATHNNQLLLYALARLTRLSRVLICYRLLSQFNKHPRQSLDSLPRLTTIR